MEWDYGKDQVTIGYDPNAAEPEVFAAAIEKLGYEAIATMSVAVTKTGASALPRLLVPTDAPGFFVDAIHRAKTAKRPVVIDFWAEWCAACLLMKHDTLEHPDVVETLRSIELIYVDLDKYPALGEAYGVAAMPDVIFADPSGNIVDRLQDFEAAPAFAARLRKLLDPPVKHDEQH